MKSITTSLYNFEILRREDFLYVDKTAEIYKVFFPKSGQYFLARPRRFGKSLLISTLKAIFEGKRELFKGLAIDSMEYDWKKYPVLHLDMGSAQAKDVQELESRLNRLLQRNAELHGITQKLEGTPADRFIDLITLLAQRSAYGQIVLLIDEYDKPLLDHLGESDITEIKKLLKAFYSVIKTTSALQRFTLITGVSKFSKVSIFSDLNNLTDLTMSEKSATLLGYTHAELEQYFGDRIPALAQKIGKTEQETYQDLETWYDGYRFEENAEPVFNPVSIGKCFENNKFRNYWFETGTPTFLIDLLKKEPIVLNQLVLPEIAFSVYEPESPSLPALLLQTGYLTLQGLESGGVLKRYRLGFPNMEVEISFNYGLAQSFSGQNEIQMSSLSDKLYEAICAGDLEAVFHTFNLFFANIPYAITIRQEKYFQSLIYALFFLLGKRISVEAEVRTNIGRIDTVVKTPKRIYLFEFKFKDTAEQALAQIRDRKYYEKYLGGTRPVSLVGVAFDPEKRNVGKWIEEEV